MIQNRELRLAFGTRAPDAEDPAARAVAQPRSSE
jgi:hypothetical protein